MWRMILVTSMAAAGAVPAVPHLAQAWTAMSTGDGLPGVVGEESYIYTEDPGYSHHGGVRGHWFKYGDDCQKLELNQWKPSLIQTAFYLKCDAVDCCYKPDAIVKPWTLHKNIFAKVTFAGFENTTELDNKTILNAEHWVNTELIPGASVQYDYFLTRDGDDIITHRIEYGATKIPSGVILYGNFTVQHNLDEFSKTFAVPSEDCSFQCPDEKIREWEAKYFRRGWSEDADGQHVVV
eukprot:TRINITY_DN113633_c0_g1_i1.p1 TRINITY_DN113633_c0_g1~~TRINITY_DN113633_c0_g1_i1.p1  ORF type:complete len:269 (+),score=42.14 TRINITY_DN113633_c0_g1_i1:97-807(+)